jgi:hypothetical protein
MHETKYTKQNTRQRQTERKVENAKCRVQHKYKLKIKSNMHEATNRKAKSKHKANQQNNKASQQKITHFTYESWK